MKSYCILMFVLLNIVFGCEGKSNKPSNVNVSPMRVTWHNSSFKKAKRLLKHVEGRNFSDFILGKNGVPVIYYNDYRYTRSFDYAGTTRYVFKIDSNIALLDGYANIFGLNIDYDFEDRYESQYIPARETKTRLILDREGNLYFFWPDYIKSRNYGARSVNRMQRIVIKSASAISYDTKSAGIRVSSLDTRSLDSNKDSTSTFYAAFDAENRLFVSYYTGWDGAQISYALKPGGSYQLHSYRSLLPSSPSLFYQLIKLVPVGKDKTASLTFFVFKSIITMRLLKKGQSISIKEPRKEFPVFASYKNKIITDCKLDVKNRYLCVSTISSDSKTVEFQDTFLGKLLNDFHKISFPYSKFTEHDWVINKPGSIYFAYSRGSQIVVYHITKGKKELCFKIDLSTKITKLKMIKGKDGSLYIAYNRRNSDYKYESNGNVIKISPSL